MNGFRDWFRDRHDDPFGQDEEAGRLLTSHRPAPTAPLPPFEGASATGQMQPGPGLGAYTPTEQFPAVRDSGPQRKLRAVPRPPAVDVLGLPARLPAVEYDPRTPVSDQVARGWRNVYVLRCEYAAAPHSTPIPCSSAHRDDDARTFPKMRQSAYDAGWRVDALGRLVCPDCQMKPEYETLFAVAVRPPEAPVAGERGAVEQWHRADDDTKWRLGLRAEMAFRERTLRHWAASHRHGSHAAVA